MKKMSVIELLLILFTFTSFAQRTYSKQNLTQTSSESLLVLLEKAKKERTKGVIISSVGAASVASIFVLDAFDVDMELGTAGFIILTGSAATIAGIPFIIIGSSRINTIKNTLSERVFIEIAPCRFHFYMARNHQKGVTRRIRF